MSAVGKILTRFILGLALGLLAALAASPRFWSGERLANVFIEATDRRETGVVRALIAPLQRSLSNSPTRIAELGRRYLLPLDQPDLLTEFARGLLCISPPDDPATAEAHLLLAQAALLQKNEGAARREYEFVQKRYWDYQQALDAEQGLRWLDASRGLTNVSEAAARQDWPRVLALFQRAPYDAFGRDDRALAASLYLEALLATGRGDEAVKVLLNIAAPSSSINLPEVIVPWRLNKYTDAPNVLRRVLASLPADHRWRKEIVCVLALLEREWAALAPLLAAVDKNVALNSVILALDQHVDEKWGAAYFRAVSTKPGLTNEDLVLLYSATAQYELRLNHADRAAQLVVEGIGRVDKKLAGGLYLLQVEMTESSDPQGALQRLNQLLLDYRGNGQVVTMIVREARDLLRRLRQDLEACAFVREHLDEIDDPNARQELLQGCPSS